MRKDGGPCLLFTDTNAKFVIMGKSGLWQRSNWVSRNWGGNNDLLFHHLYKQFEDFSVFFEESF